VDGDDGEHAREDHRRLECAAGDEPDCPAWPVALDDRIESDGGADAGERREHLDEAAPQHALVAAGAEDEVRVVHHAVVEP
jgi:hypothetical protein